MSSSVMRALALLIFLLPAPASADHSPLHNQCPDTGIPYCENVGKKAFNALFAPRNIFLGPIKGVVWRLQNAPLKENPSERYHYSDEATFYYIIGPGGVVVDYSFLRKVREIEAR